MTNGPRALHRRNLGFAVALAVLVLWFIGAQWVRSVEPLGLDQGLFACFARWVPRGWLPYRDLYDSKPPLFLYSWALSAVVPGDVVQAAWRLEAVWLATTMALAFALARRVWDRWSGLAAVALVFAALWAPGWGGYWSRAQADELSALPVLGAAWLAWRALDRPGLAFWAGLLTGVAGLYKIPSMAMAAAWPLTWLLAGSLRPSLRRTGLLAVGIVVPWALAFGWFAAHGALGDFYQAAFVYHRHNAAFISPPWSHVLPTFARELGLGAPLLLLCAAIGLALLRKRRAREFWWLLPWIVLTMASVILQRQLAGYQYLLAMPGLAMAGAFGVVELARGAAQRPRRLAWVLGLASVLALSVESGVQWWRAYGIDLLHLSGRLTRDEYLRRLQPDGFSSSTEEAAARYLREHSAPGEGLLVWGMSPGLYALADRRPVTRYPFHKILMTDAPLSRMIPGLDERRAELMRRLRADPPAYVLIGRNDRNGFEPETSMMSLTRFTELAAFVRSQYHPEIEIGNFLVVRRGPAP